MGDEHPASKKVVVEFKPTELSGLNEQQQIKLIKLVGSRFNPEKQIIKMSCESFETPAQNKRYLGDLVQKLVAEAKNSKDMFKDLPIDLRHHKQKPIYKFPEEWKIERPATIVRGKTIRGKGRVKRETVQQLQESGNFVDGVQVIKEAMAALPRERLTVPAGGKQSTVLGTRTGRLPARRGQQTGWAPSW
jgi:small subunit ribosomal protein S35